jgi:hypothetical protein
MRWIVRAFVKGKDTAVGELYFDREWVARLVAAALLRGEAPVIEDETVGYWEMHEVEGVAIMREREEE